ncbi:MAG: DNA-directed RNA polymerase subunit omega [Clostridiales bacterium]|nr:DNA-directed RNA polymerase subunit omega [Clostridiales bacterium]
MLNKPPINQMMPYVDSKYTLVIVAAKRARSTIENNPDMLHVDMLNPVSLALDEVAEGKIAWRRVKDGIK